MLGPHLRTKNRAAICLNQQNNKSLNKKKPSQKSSHPKPRPISASVVGTHNYRSKEQTYHESNAPHPGNLGLRGLFLGRSRLVSVLLRLLREWFPLLVCLHKWVNSFFTNNILPMKKHLVFSVLFAAATAVATQAQSLTYAGTPSPTDAIQLARQTTEQHLDIFNSRNYDRAHCDCHKCQKQKKSRKHNDCKGKGNHYGKHKNRNGKHDCACTQHRCQSNKKRDCDDDARHRRGRNDRSDERGNDWGINDRGDNSRQQPQTQQPQTQRRNPASTAKVKTRPTPTAKPAPSAPGTKSRSASPRQ